MTNEADKKNVVVPFGKYKGQPVEVLAEDREYCEWLAGQDWFRTRFTAIHTLIINNFAAVAETPAHNALQALFTKPDFVLAFVMATSRFSEDIQERNAQREQNAAEAHRLENEVDERTEHMSDWYYANKVTERAKKVAALREEPKIMISGPAFEVGGADVSLSAYVSTVHYPQCWRIECKPSVGDDYPGILRQMRASKCNTLLIGRGGYIGTGATFQQFVAIFSSADISVVLLSDIPGFGGGGDSGGGGSSD